VVVPSLATQYQEFVDQTIARTLKGEFRSQEQVYRLVAKQLENGTSEILERCLANQATQYQQQLAQETSEIKQAKITRQINALKTLQEGWNRWHQEDAKQRTGKIILQQLLNAPQAERLLHLVQALDINQTDSLNHAHLEYLAQQLSAASEYQEDESSAFELRQLASGLQQGLQSYARLEADLISWIYREQRPIGFGANAGNDPWQTWATKTTSVLPQALFTNQAQNAPASEIVLQQQSINLSAWTELITLLRSLQISLVNWFDRQPYDFQVGNNLAATTLINFAAIWCEFSNGFIQTTYLNEMEREYYAQICFQITLQILRTFAQRDNFPLYGERFTFFVGTGLRDTIAYLDRPLREVENTQEKARILTVLGYSLRSLNQPDRALVFHQEALELANQANDQPCTIANICHISRLFLIQKNYENAVNQARRALILARQTGDAKGEANALVTVGYGEVMQLQSQEVVSAEQMESPMRLLQQGQALAQKFTDLQNQAFAAVGLGAAYILLAQMPQAQQILEQGLTIIRQVGDRDLQALSYGYLAEATYQSGQLEIALGYAYIGMYLLEQRNNANWRQTAALLQILEGKLGTERFAQAMQQQRSQLLKQIGQDGIDHIANLIQKYRQGER
jgi:hypothetical protein